MIRNHFCVSNENSKIWQLSRAKWVFPKIKKDKIESEKIHESSAPDSILRIYILWSTLSLSLTQGLTVVIISLFSQLTDEDQSLYKNFNYINSERWQYEIAGSFCSVFFLVDTKPN